MVAPVPQPPKSRIPRLAEDASEIPDTSRRLEAARESKAVAIRQPFPRQGVTTEHNAGSSREEGGLTCSGRLPRAGQQPAEIDSAAAAEGAEAERLAADCQAKGKSRIPRIASQFSEIPNTHRRIEAAR
jgi:hypothetical protein